MITSTKALEIILNSTANFGTESIPFIESTGRILKENVIADRDFPPFDRVSMDGVAIDIDAFNQGQRQFKIEGIQAAGSPQLTLRNPKNCIEAMTGAVLPKKANAVIQYELTDIQNGIVTLNTNDVKFYKNIHKKGLDGTKGTPLLSQNTVISAAEIGVLATVGKAQVIVAKQPKICIISTGDELVEVNQTPLPHQIRRSNVFTLVALLKRLNLKADTLHIKDDKTLLKQKIETTLNNYDVLMFSGAVSKGKFDFIPDVLDSLGVKKLFHRVKQKPGKPFWFGTKSHTERGRSTKTVFAFPGNPVSTFVSCLKYFYPWYYKSVGVAIPVETAILASDFEFKSPLTYFLQVKLETKDGYTYAHPVTGNGSGDLANLAVADAFIELPGDETLFKKGRVFPLLKYR
ncbi:MAG: molybdopterin molybdotransferase MoeA [Flavobacteriaceae bacterium]|nr:molybdopterin molybdotransferase MoeA [Flavobacteriaceae bacterium]